MIFKTSFRFFATVAFATMSVQGANVHDSPSTLPDDYFLLTSPPFSGHANNMIQLGSELLNRGYKVVMAMNADEQNIKTRILREGIDYYDLGNKTYSQQMIDGVNAGGADGLNPFPASKFLSKILPELAYGIHFDLEEMVKAKPPKALIYEEFILYGGHLANRYNIPAILIAPHTDPMLFPLMDTCPWNSPHFIRNLDPGFFERVVNVLLRIILDRWGALWFTPITRRHCKAIGVPADACFPLKHHIAKYGILPIAPTGYPVSVCDIPSYFHRVGQFVRPNMVHPLDQEEWFQQREQEGADVIYFATGSDTIIHKWQVEALLGGIDIVRERREKPLYVYYARGQDVLSRYNEIRSEDHPYVYWADYAPQHWILNHTSTKVFISHCGAGGVNEASYFGTPMYALPFGRDQPSLAAAVTAAGMAITADTYSLKAKTVAQEIETLLVDESFTLKAKQMARIGQNMGGASEAATLIERHLAVGSNYHSVSFTNDWPWWKQESLDVFAFLAVCCIGILFLLHKIYPLLSERMLNLKTKSKIHLE